MLEKITIAGLTAIIFSLLAFDPSPAPGQGLFGTISGVVMDHSGAVVPGANVMVVNMGTNVVTTLTTNSTGAYTATTLNPGSYDVRAMAKGFKTAVRSGITLQVGANVKVDLTLEVGAATQTVEVKGTESPILQTQQSNLGETVNERQLASLPTQSGSGRSVFNLLFLTPGVSEQVGVGAGDNNSLRINGDRPRTQDYLLDGTSMDQPVFGGNALNPSPDSIQEFKVETNSMSAQYGTSDGGVIMIVTKSGTNHFHGSAYEYNGNDKLNARNFFNESLPKNPYTYNEFGGTIGGPIIKNKLFFFTDYQGIRSHGSNTPSTSFVPDAHFRAGDLSGLCAPPASFNSAGVCSNAKEQIYMPGTTTPVPDNVIAAINPISAKLLALYPKSTIPAVAVGGTQIPGVNQLTETSPFSQTANAFDPRIDWNPSAADHVFGTFHRETSTGVAYDLVLGPAGEQISGGPAYATTIGWTHMFGSATLNDFHFGYMHRVGNRATYGQGFTSPSDFGILGIPKCLASIPNTTGGTKCGTPGVSITGYTGLGTGETLYEPARTLVFTDMVAKVIGQHSLKVGAQFRQYAINNYQPNDVTGNFSFLGGQTGNAFADFLFGAMSNGSSVQVQNAMVESRAWAGAYFIQDDFKISRKLTLNLGLRWQWDNSFHELHNGLANFNPYTAEWEQAGVNAPATQMNSWTTEIGPRIGFAWNPVSRFVVRGGYGIMYPGFAGHGRAGNGNPGPNLLATTPFNAGTNWSGLPPITNPSPSAITAPIPVNSNVSFSTWSPRNQDPEYTELWNFTIEKQFGSNSTIQASYVGSHGLHLPINYAYNICQQTPASTATLGYSATTSPYCSPKAAQEAGIYNLVVNPTWWGMSSSIYHSLELSYNHRFSHGFSLVSNFTWSKLIDDSSSDWGGFWQLDVLGQNFYDPGGERSVSAGNIPLRFTIAPIVELPFGHGKRWAQSGIASEIVGGWRVAGIFTASDGGPFGITDNSYGYCNAAHTLSDRPNVIGNLLPPGFHQSINEWFNIDALDFSGTCPAPGLVDLTGPGDPKKAFGNAPRYFSNISVPGLKELDFSVQKDFRIPVGESTRLEFEGDFYNALNHPNFGYPASDPTGGGFGTVSYTAIPNRTVQLGLHLHF